MGEGSERGIAKASLRVGDWRASAICLIAISARGVWVARRCEDSFAVDVDALSDGVVSRWDAGDLAFEVAAARARV